MCRLAGVVTPVRTIRRQVGGALPLPSWCARLPRVPPQLPVCRLADSTGSPESRGCPPTPIQTSSLNKHCILVKLYPLSGSLSPPGDHKPVLALSHLALRAGSPLVWGQEPRCWMQSSNLLKFKAIS